MPQLILRKKHFRYAWGIGVASCFLVFIFGIILGPTIAQTITGYPCRLVDIIDVIFFTAIVAFMLPVAAVDRLVYNRIKNIEKYLVHFVRDIAEAQRTGRTFTGAIELASKKEYGPLSEELRRVVIEMSLGVPYSQALENFARRVDSPLTYQTVTLLKQAGLSGGNLERILGEVAEYVRETQILEREKASTLRMYTIILLVAYGVFLGTIFILYRTFFVQMAQMGAQMAAAGGGQTATVGGVTMGGFTIGQINLSEYRHLFFHIACINSIISGISIGKISTGRGTAGFFWAILMVLVAIVLFNHPLLIPFE